MDLTGDIELIRSELDITSDKFSQILPLICRTFIKKYERRPQSDANRLAADLKQIIKQTEVYGQYTCETISKYHSLNRLENLVRSLFEGQSLILVFLSNIIGQNLTEKHKFSQKIDTMTERVFEQCASCTRPLKKSEMQSLQDEIGMRFKNRMSYFQRDFQQISKLSEEASLIFKKDALHIDGISEHEFNLKFQRINQNIANAIQNVTQSLNNIALFQQKFSEMQQYQYQINKKQKDMMRTVHFNPKNYMVDMSRHFYELIKKVEQKLDNIRRFFRKSIDIQTQTVNAFNECTPEKMKQLKDASAKQQIQSRKMELYIISLQTQISEVKTRIKLLDDNYVNLRNQKQKCEEKIKSLEIELMVMNEKQMLRRKSQVTSDKLIQSGILTSINKSTNVKNKKSPKQSPSQTQKQLSEEQKRLLQQKKLDYENLINDSINLKNRKQSKMSNNVTNFRRDPEKKQSNTLPVYSSTLVKTAQKIRTSLKKQKRLSKNAESTKQENVSNSNKQNQNGRASPIKIDEDGPLIEPPNKAKKVAKMVVIQKVDSQNTLQSISQNYDESQKSSIRYIRDFQYVNLFSITIPNSESIKQIQKSNGVHKIIPEKIQTQRPVLTKLTQSIKQRETIRYEAKQSNIDNHIQSIYKTLNQESALQFQISCDQFKDKLNEFLQQIKKPLNKYKKNSFKQTKYSQFNSTQPKTKMVYKSFDEDMMKKTQKQSLTKMHIKSIIPKEDVRLHQNTIWSKNITESNQDSHLQKQKQRQTLRRKSSNTINEQQSSPKMLLKLQKFNLTSNLQNTRSLFESLPTLKKKFKQANYRKSIQFEQDIDWQNDDNTQNFQDQDLKIIYQTVQNAYQIGQSSLKHRKTQSCIFRQQQSLHSIELSYMKQFFARLATIHIVNKPGYQKIKLFLICPYDYVISQMSQLKLIKSGSDSNAMRQSIKKILLLHRACTTKGEICKHLRYFYRKVGKLQSVSSEQVQEN